MEFTMNELIDELKRRGFEAREIDTVKNGVKKAWYCCKNSGWIRMSYILCG